MSQISKKELVGIKVETTQGTAVTLGTTDFVLAYDVKVTPKVEMQKQNFRSTSLSRFADLPGKKFYEVEFSIPLKASGTAGTAVAPLGAALQACGFTETVNAGTSVIYGLTSTALTNFYGPGKSATVKVYLDGMLHVAAGCMFDLSFDIEAGKVVGLKFKGQGIYAAVTDASFASNTPYGAGAPVVKSALLSIDSYSMVASKLSIALGNKIAMRDDVSSANSILGFLITDRDVTGSVDPERVTVATYDVYGKMMSGSEASGTITIGSGAGNIITITAPKIQYGQVENADRNGIAIHNIPLMFNRSTGDDELVITMT